MTSVRRSRIRGASAEVDVLRRRIEEHPDHDAQCCRRAGAVRSEEAGHPTRCGGERHVVDRERVAALLGEPVDGHPDVAAMWDYRW
jgi:hypothetical protein